MWPPYDTTPRSCTVCSNRILNVFVTYIFGQIEITNRDISGNKTVWSASGVKCMLVILQVEQQ